MVVVVILAEAEVEEVVVDGAAVLVVSVFVSDTLMSLAVGFSFFQAENNFKRQ